MKWAKRIAFGLLVGCVGTSLGFVISQADKNASAAVLVYDAQNVLEAAKTAVNTANILTESQKEVVLQILDMSSMSTQQLAWYLQSLTKKQTEVFDESGGKIGALNPGNSVDAFWSENFKNVEDVINGRITVVDAYEANQKSLKALEQTQKDSLHNAKTTQNASNDMSEMIHTALDNSANAEGTKAAVQANTQAVAVAAMGTLYTNNVLSDALAQQALRYQKEAADEAAGIALQKSIAKNMKQSVEKMRSFVESR